MQQRFITWLRDPSACSIVWVGGKWPSCCMREVKELIWNILLNCSKASVSSSTMLSQVSPLVSPYNMDDLSWHQKTPPRPSSLQLVRENAELLESFFNLQISYFLQGKLFLTVLKVLLWINQEKGFLSALTGEPACCQCPYNLKESQSNKTARNSVQYTINFLNYDIEKHRILPATAALLYPFRPPKKAPKNSSRGCQAHTSKYPGQDAKEPALLCSNWMSPR